MERQERIDLHKRLLAKFARMSMRELRDAESVVQDARGKVIGTRITISLNQGKPTPPKSTGV